MRRLLLIMGMLSACTGYVKANEIVVPNVIIPKGGTATLDIQLNNEQVLSPVFEFYLRLPEGITVVENSEQLGNRFSGTQVSVKCSYDETEGRYWIMAMIPPIPSADVPIPGENGTLVTVNLQADDALEENSVVGGSLEDIEFRTWYEDKSGEKADLQSSVDFQITIGQPDDGRIKFDENATALPTYTAGEKYNVRMTRTIHANQWSTIVLPFTLTKAKAEVAFGSDVQLAEFAGFKVDYGDDEENVVPLGITVNFNSYTMTTRMGMTGGKPFIIKTTKDIESFEADECSMVRGVTDVAKADEYNIQGIFSGSLVKTVVPEDGLFISDEKFYYSTGKTNIKAFRGWFELGAVLDKETSFDVKMAVFLDDEETHVEGINGGQQTSDAVYDIGGRKVAKPQQHGVYIINGKKILK